ncbi:hypothetical protein NC652_036019 [Populus alba x Populus x berolinensis]|nr:hypothetical protein NC652_036019 [Populus alba x Populus x berolinensis]
MKRIQMTQTSMPKNCKISTEMLQKLLDFYISAECKHMHQHKNMKLKVTRFSIFLEIELEQIKFKSSP